MTEVPSKLKDAELRRLLLLSGRRVGSPSPAALLRTLSRIEAAAAAGLIATGVNSGSAMAATLGGAAGTPGSTAIGMGGLSGAKAAASSMVVKWFVSGMTVGLIGAGTVGAVVVSQGTWSESPPPVASGQGQPIAARPNTSTSRLRRDPPHAEPSRAKEVPSDGRFESRDRETSPPAPAPMPRSALPMSPELARELSLLDRARNAIEGGNVGAALGWLKLYQQQFPSGQLAPESELLRRHVQSLIRDGQAPRQLETIQ